MTASLLFLGVGNFQFIPKHTILTLFRARAQRQKEVVKNLYAECMALEELLEESVNTLGPDARDILAQVRCERFPEGFHTVSLGSVLGYCHFVPVVLMDGR